METTTLTYRVSETKRLHGLGLGLGFHIYTDNSHILHGEKKQDF